MFKQLYLNENSIKKIKKLFNMNKENIVNLNTVIKMYNKKYKINKELLNTVAEVVKYKSKVSKYRIDDLYKKEINLKFNLNLSKEDREKEDKKLLQYYKRLLKRMDKDNV